MTNRVQTLRSSTSGAVPAAGSRLPGELWVNFADSQLGLIDASKNAQRLIAVRYFSASANYAAGDFVIQAGVLYAAKGAITAGAFNGTQWTKVAAATDPDGPYLALAGGTLTGALVLAADPGAALGAATKQYVDGKVTAAPFLPLAGGTMLAPITLSGPPSAPLHAATKAYVDSGAFVPIGGGAMTGDLILNRDAQIPLGAATKQQVDARGAGDNRLINGDMRIDQRNAGASGTAQNTYTVDRWLFQATQASKGTWSRATNGAASVAVAAGFPYALGFTSSSAYASIATDIFGFNHRFEGDMVSDFAFGTANAQAVTLSFWAYSSLSGTFSGSMRNYAGDRSYPFTFPLTANTWAKTVITIPGDTAGTWVMSGNAGAAILNFDLGSGSNSRGAANAWASGNYFGVTGAVSAVGTNGATFYVTGVKLEIGSVATPYPRQSLAKSQADCERYFRWLPYNLSIWATAAGQYATSGLPFSAMRAAPTIGATATDPNATPALALVTASNVDQITPYSVRLILTASGIGACFVSGYRVSASAEL